MRAIIMAGGVASRFAGTHKELLPISETDCALTWNIKLARDKLKASEIVVVSSREKIQEHARTLKDYDVQFKLTPNATANMWEGIKVGLDANQDGCLLMADTILDFNEYRNTLNYDAIDFGVFLTNEPHRFSVLKNGIIVTKPRHNTQPIEKAWGFIQWNKYVSAFWLAQEYRWLIYDDALNSAVSEHNNGQLSTQHLKYYYDIGTFEAYKAFLARGDVNTKDKT